MQFHKNNIFRLKAAKDIAAARVARYASRQKRGYGDTQKITIYKK